MSLSLLAGRTVPTFVTKDKYIAMTQWWLDIDIKHWFVYIFNIAKYFGQILKYKTYSYGAPLLSW